MKQLLAISWAMPPLLFPRSLQVSRTLKFLSQLGWQATVLCVNPHSVRRGAISDPGLETLSRDSYRVIRVDSSEQALHRRLLWRFVPVLSQLPDAQRVWVRRAARAAAAALSGRNFSALVSFAQPWSDHLIGLRVHRASRLPWIAHFSDPWVDSPYFEGPPWGRGLCSKMEAAVIREADAVVFVSPQTADLVMAKYPAAWRSKVCVIPHGYDTSVLRLLETPARTDDRLRLVFTGNLYAQRGPTALLEALRSLAHTRPLAEQVQVVFVGANDRCYQGEADALGVGDTVTFLGSQSFLESLQAAASADVLLVIDAPDSTASVFLPSKLADYLVLRKPILGITPLSGASGDLLRRLGCPVVAPQDVEGIAHVIEQLIERRRSGRLSVGSAFDSVAAEYDSRNTAQTLGALLERYVAAHAVGEGPASARWRSARDGYV